MALTINGERVPDRTLDRELLRLSAGLEMDAPEAGGIDPGQLRTAALRNVVDRTLLLQMADHRGIQVTSGEVQAELVRRWGVERSSACDPASMDSIREDLHLRRLEADLTRHVPRPGRAEVEHFYRANLHRYRVPEAVEAAHILCGCTGDEEESLARQMIDLAMEELRRGTAFARVADRYSDCKGVGGSVGWVARGSMVQEFEDVIFSLPSNQHSSVFRTVFGFHIATVKRRRKEGVQPFDAVKLEIAKRMHDGARTGVLQRVLARVRAESDIQYKEGASYG